MRWVPEIWNVFTPLIARFMGPTWGPSGADRTQVGPMLAPWSLLSGTIFLDSGNISLNCGCTHRLHYLFHSHPPFFFAIRTLTPFYKNQYKCSANVDLNWFFSRISTSHNKFVLYILSDLSELINPNTLSYWISVQIVIRKCGYSYTGLAIYSERSWSVGILVSQEADAVWTLI